jgi:hypothetical protein
MEEEKMKGWIEDFTTISFILLLLGILGVCGFLFADKVFTAMEASPLPGMVNFTSAAPQVHAQATGSFQFIDGIIAFALVLLVGGSFALAFYSRGHPYLAIITVFLQLFFVIGGYFVKLFWQGFSTASPDLQAVAINNFPITNLIMTFLPFIGFITLIGIIVLYFTKSSTEYAQGY